MKLEIRNKFEFNAAKCEKSIKTTNDTYFTFDSLGGLKKWVYRVLIIKYILDYF